MAELPRPAVAPCRRGGDAPRGSGERPRSPAAEPIRFTSSDGRDSVDPSGRPRIARRWFSNWLVAEPSIVQWPVLWTRGANSFASSAPPTSKSSSASTPTYPSSSSSRVPYPSASACGASAAGAREVLQDPVLVHVLDERPEARVAVAPAHGEQRQLAVERDTLLQDMVGVLAPDMSPPDAGPFRHSRGGGSSGSPGTSPPRRRCARSGSRVGGRAASRRAGPATPRARRHPGSRRPAAPPRPGRSRTRR